MNVVNKMEESFFGKNGKKAPRGYEKAKRTAEAFGRRCGKMEERIIATPAKTFDGLVAKARALECNLVDGETVEGGTDSEFAASFAKDILGAHCQKQTRGVPNDATAEFLLRGVSLESHQRTTRRSFRFSQPSSIRLC